MTEAPGDLAGWLDFISAQHSSEIDLGLDRLRLVANQLGLSHFNCPLITVAGTNGKGSSITALESFYIGAGYRTACYTSPHLTVFNERIRIDGVFVVDDELCAAFAEINSARGAIPLTYFEFATLAAYVIFMQQELDIILLEVGLGGRLDATNLFPADVALITRIGIDHTAWLGNDREAIGVEKAGIVHEGKIVVISDPQPPESLLDIAHKKATKTFCLNQDYQYKIKSADWCWQQGEQNILSDLPLPGLYGLPQFNNLAGVLMCLVVLQKQLPVSEQTIRDTLPGISVNGRFQIVKAKPQQILDVAHNPDSMELLAENLNAHPVAGKTHAVVAMLKDKDIYQSLYKIYPSIDYWYIAGLTAARGETAENLRAVLEKLGTNVHVTSFENVEQAWKRACGLANDKDRVVVFGSFHTVGVIIEKSVSSN
ncbi:MAG: bifunctional tetrahydrofolate synthase/dihydrofolate synthase [Pseudomonadota bacterium]|nr:bifunctional tetrahydrofolate synthase/dihydrofolate synthase [Pseudomonadota bacterium]